MYVIFSMLTVNSVQGKIQADSAGFILGPSDLGQTVSRCNSDQAAFLLAVILPRALDNSHLVVSALVDLSLAQDLGDFHQAV